MNYKLTIDINLMHEDPKIPAMDALKRWKSEGKIALIEAAPPRVEPTARPSLPEVPPKAVATGFRGKSRTRINKQPAGAVSFKAVAAVLFPQKDSQKLNMGELNDVAHLVKHHGSKNEFFVTHNRQDFIEGGRRERLKASFGIIALSPEEAVALLSGIEGWN